MNYNATCDPRCITTELFPDYIEILTVACKEPRLHASLQFMKTSAFIVLSMLVAALITVIVDNLEDI